LQTAKKLQQRVKDAMNRLAQQEKIKRVNLTDEDAQLMKGRSGIITGYNAQAMVSPLNPETARGSGMLITAAEVVNSASDSGQLAPMLEKAEELTGQRVLITLADGGYHTAASLEAGERRGQLLVMGERYKDSCTGPYFKDQFETVILAPMAIGFLSAGCAGLSSLVRVRSAYIEPRGRHVVLVRLSASVLRINMPDEHCGSVLLMFYCSNIDSGCARTKHAVCTPAAGN
jgi:hypothetical protein